jgi:creatinine amidohydrolase/Fe(II)-dependent formamide hydrolase-like protein
MTRRLDRLSWPEIRERLDAGRRTVVVAFGATEQHGPHLPLATDTLLGDELASRIAERLDALIAPTVPIGCSSHHGAFAGTLSLSDETFAAIVGDLVESFARSGFTRAILVPSHGGNFVPLARAVEALDPPDTLRIDALTDLSVLASLPVLGEQQEGIPMGEGGLHAGEWETSLLLASEPQLVHMERAAAGYVGSPEEALSAVFDVGVQNLSTNGVIGDPARADRERGLRYWEHITDLIIERLAADEDN